jgi:signal transduction histidine kinase
LPDLLDVFLNRFADFLYGSVPGKCQYADTDIGIAMIKFFKKNRTFRLRATRVYLITILICTLLLFCINVFSLFEQNRKVSALSDPRYEFWGRTIAKEDFYVGLSAIMLLCAMGIGLKLYIGVSWDIRWFQLRSDFVSGVSHEFKTPLSLIRLYSETLVTANQDYSEEDRNNYIRIIARESERMSRMVDNVLSFAKIEQRRYRYEMEEGDIRETVTQTVNDYSEYLTWSGFHVRCSIWPNLPPVRFNPEQVSEMILNLMDNARKYSGKSRQIRVNVWVQNEEVIIEVRDHGIGIPPGEREKIFQPFHRLAKGSEHGGCGLGLYLVDQVMKQHGGRVEVESDVNSGSRFRLVFPSGKRKKVKAWKKGTHELTEAHFERQVQN